MPAKLPKVQGLRRRWLAGSIVPVAAILLLVGVLISVGFASNYYNSARSTLRAKAAAGALRRGLLQHLCHDRLQRVLPQRHAVRRHL